MEELDQIPSSWKQVALADLFLDPKSHIVDGPFGSNLKASEYKSEGIPVLRIQNIDRNKFVDKNINFVTEEKAEFLKRHSFRSGDIIITKLGTPVGKACFVPSKYKHGIIVADLIRARITHGHVDPKFLVYQINSNGLIKQFERFTKGTTRPRINLGIVRQLEFNLPPINEQHRIVAKIEELFSELDNGVENLKLAKNQLKVYRQALLKHAFEGKLTEEWRKENNPEPAEKLLERIKEERQARYEQELKDWKAAVKKWEKEGKKGKKPRKPKLSNLQKINLNNEKLPATWFWGDFENSVLNLDGDRVPISSAVRYSRKGKFPYYGATGIVDYIDDFLFDGKYLLIGEDGANLLSKARDLAFIVEGKVWVNNHAHVLQTLIGLDINFLCYYFNSLSLNEYVTGTAQPKLTQANLNKIRVPYCTEVEQNFIVNEIESQLSIVEKFEETIIKSLKQSESQRQSILKKAFEGKLVDQDPEDEPASELLNRIQEEKKKYLEEQKQQKKKAPKKTKKMSKELSIEDVLKTSKKPMLAKEVWQQSMHKGDIEKFYAELKELGNKVEEIREGMESKLMLK